MMRLIRDIRLTLASRSYPEIVVICTTDAGRRIAIASGFHLFESDGEITHGKFVGRGSKEAANLQKQEAASQQRRTLADLARQQAEVDQATSGKAGRKTGSRMLAFMNESFLSGSGNDKFGQA